MKTNITLDQLVLTNLAELFNASLEEFTFYTSLPAMPGNANDFAQFLDSIPNGDIFFNPATEVNYFSQIYGKILKAQKKQSFAIEMGAKRFNDKANWLHPFTIPKNAPTFENAKNTIDSAGEKKVVVKSNEQPIQEPVVPEYPNIIYSVPLLDFFRKVAQAKFTTKVEFSKAASIPVELGNWFYSGAFLYAYQTPDNWNSDIISWKDVFGDNGILKYINTSIALISDMTIELQVSGNFDNDTVQMLKAIPDQVIFPFFQKIKGSELNFTLETDHSIKITLTVPKKSDYVFGVKYQSVKSLVS